MSNSTGDNTKTAESTLPKGRLIVDLVGPYAVHFTKCGVNVYAPPCVNHFANVLTDANDIPLIGLNAALPNSCSTSAGFVYQLEIEERSKRNPGAVKGLHDGHNGYLVVKPKDAFPPIDSTQCFLIFKLPIPDKIVPLMQEWVFIHKGSARQVWLDPDKSPKTNWKQTRSDQSQFFFGQYARALRLIYLDCEVTPKIVLESSPKTAPSERIGATLKTFNPRTVGYDQHTFHFTLRFASNGSDLDDNHQDAYTCFQTMRCLIRDAGAWRVDFDDVHVPGSDLVSARSPDQMNNRNHSGNPPLDCHAAVLVVQDPT